VILSNIERRKQRHIELSVTENVQSDIQTGLECVKLIHRSLPEINLEEIDTSTQLYGKKIQVPLIISAITGGTLKAKMINSTLSSIAEERGIGIGVGSQRIALENPKIDNTFKIVREKAPTALVIGNLGSPQLALGWGVTEAEKCVNMISADALAIHMNPLQESVQVTGQTNYSGILRKIEYITKHLRTPIIMKETGCGIAYEEAVRIEQAGASGVEISGLGGTSWAAVEHHIAKELGDKNRAVLGKTLWNWGIPTAISLIECRKSTNLKIIASGGIRTGMDIAKSIALGADVTGIAQPFLMKVEEGERVLKEYVEQLIQELRVVMFLVGAENIEKLKKTPSVITGTVAEWLRIRGFKPEEYSKKRY
jgi:isopentenyl-diphosphate delta-isomerase